MAIFTVHISDADALEFEAILKSPTLEAKWFSGPGTEDIFDRIAEIRGSKVHESVQGEPGQTSTPK